MSDCLARGFEPGLVSVILPIRDRAHLISETLDSVLAQTYGRVEVLVVDDGSSDATRQAVEQFARTRSASNIRYARQAKAGGCRARNLGMALSRGEFLQFLDSDDLLHPEKLARQVAHLWRRLALDFVVAQRLPFTSRADLADGPLCRRVPAGPITLESFFAGASFVTIQPLFRRVSLVPVGPWDDRLRCSQEANYFGRALAHGLRGEFTPEVLCYKRLHPGNLRATLDRKNLLAGTVRSREGVCREAERQGLGVPRILKFQTLQARSRWKAFLGDARSALSDLLAARRLVPPGAVPKRIELVVRSWVLRMAGAAAYTVACDSLHTWKRTIAAKKSRMRISLAGPIASNPWTEPGAWREPGGRATPGPDTAWNPETGSLPARTRPTITSVLFINRRDKSWEKSPTG